MTAAVANNLYRIATSSGPGAVPASIFWMKTRGKWRETDRHEIVGKDDGPVQINNKLDISNLDNEQLDVLMSALEKSITKK